MSLSLSSLLNPSPDSETQVPSPPQNNALPPLQPVQSPEEVPKRPSSSAHSDHAFIHTSTSTQEAAQALAKLSASPVAPPTQWAGYNAPDANQLERQRSWESRSSGYGEPSITLPPPVSFGSSRKMSSPTLEQYQVASRSPEQRRASIVPPQEPNVTLPPLQGFASHGHGAQQSQTSKHEPSQAQNSPTDAINGGEASAHASKAVDNPSTASAHTPAPLSRVQTSATSAHVDDRVSSTAVIKQETVSTPQPPSPAEAHRPSDVDIHTSKTVASLKSEHSLKTQSPLRESSIPIPSTETAAMEAPAANPKKRPAPSKKKGTASTVKKEKAPPAKKRKVEPKRSATPSSRASKPPTIKGTPANSSPAPSNRSYSAEPNEEPYDDDEDMDDDGSDGDVYCICRKPDSGTFMIGCDGTCDDWFHGKCVGIEERDKNLIDKYMCPNCTKKGIGQTTWKRMCRRGGCRQPAKVGKVKNGATGSKYCSDECGGLYFREMAARTRGREDSAKNRASRRKSSIADDGKPVVEDELGARGGALSAGEVKALLNVSKTAEEFKKLGDGVLSPPATPDGQDQEKKSQYSDAETQALQRIQVEKEEARRRHANLKDRMKFITLVKQSASRLATEKELKPKDFCGYDSRLEWTEQRFQAWRTTKAGQQAFELDTLQKEKSNEKDNDMEEVIICDRKKCARHLDWSKLAVDDIRFEMSDNSDRMRALDKDERELKERAALRAQSGTALSGEGTVEVHGLGIAVEAAPGGDKMDVDTAPLEAPTIAETVEAV